MMLKSMFEPDLIRCSRSDPMVGWDGRSFCAIVPGSLILGAVLFLPGNGIEDSNWGRVVPEQTT